MKFIPQYEPLIKKEYADAVHAQIMSGWIGPGERVEELEAKICAITGAKHCVATTSGTAALFLALKALESNSSNISIFPDYTFIAGANAARLIGHNVNLIDIKEDTLCIDPNILEKILEEDNKIFKFSNPNINSVIYVNHNGYVGRDRYDVQKHCEKYAVPMIEDSSQALGMYDKNKIHAGRIGTFGIFSFSVPKIVTAGQGGCLITDSYIYSTLCRRLRDHGDNWKKTKVHKYLGANFKFNDILASFVLSQLNILDELLEIRKQVFNWYREHIELVDFGMDSTWMVLFRTQKADPIINALKAEQIQAVKYYNPIHTNLPYSFSDTHFPVANKVAEEIVYLPSSLTLTHEDVKRICQVIKDCE